MGSSLMASFVRALIYTSEKAANLARAIRAEQELFALLIQEKSDGEKNTRFVQDFKTLADVLIQETIRHDLGKKFPRLLPADIHGEESAIFTNALGESVTVEVQSTCEETATLLARVLDNNMTAARLLATVVHSDATVNVEDEVLLALEGIDLLVENVGIWIDPIDSTAEYINGKDEDGECTVSTYGLPCVTVLIGVYDKKTGEPIIGLVNQPFFHFDVNSGSWNGRWFWGVDYEGQKYTSVFPSTILTTMNSSARGTVLVSGNENAVIKKVLAKNYDVIYAAGAGYKLLCVALGFADAYILSKATTYKWDSCAPHALAKAVGGGVVKYNETMAVDLLAEDVEFSKQLSELQLVYNAEEDRKNGIEKWCNIGGIIAYRDTNFLRHILELLK